MVQMPAGNKNEYWALVLVRVPSNRVAAVLQALRILAEPQQYGGGWYIKRIEVLQPRGTVKDEFALTVAVKAGSEATLNQGLGEIADTIAGASGNQASSDTYNVTAIHYSANW